MSFDPQSLWPILAREPAPRRYLLAFSGGLDSHVLLHALCALRDRFPETAIHALHVHHGLSPRADAWAAHCKTIAEALGVPCEVFKVHAHPLTGQSPEAAARAARYQAFARVMRPGDYLLTAHHQDDQAETLLLQLLRGSGPHGLAAMPARASFAAGLLLRPLLGFSRAELHDYAL
ncbi:MAG: tRNA lysidine(34) synthetase TilS, partial [Gammaproteobacteria bacterium RBG_16_57_12]